MEDKKISEMAELLCKGAKMLSQYCPECGVPLFKKGDKVFCPSCNKTVIFESSSELETKEKIEQKEDLGRTNDVEIEVGFEDNLKKARTAVKNSIVKICVKMEEEEDVSSLLKMIEAVERLISIYNALKSVV